MRLDSPLDEVFRTGSSARVLRGLFELPEGFGVSARELARRSGVSHPTASDALASFVDQGLVRRRRSLRGDEYLLNREHILAGKLEELFDLERSLRGELVSFLADRIAGEAPDVEHAFLYGSAAWGETTVDSDLDVAVICHPAMALLVESQMERVAEAVRARFGNRVSVLVGTHVAMVSRVPSNRQGSRLWKRIFDEGIPIDVQQRG